MKKLLYVLGLIFGAILFPSTVLDALAYRWLRRRGYATVEASTYEESRAHTMALLDYVERSGHLNTVSGRRPRAVARLREGLGASWILGMPDRPRVKALVAPS